MVSFRLGFTWLTIATGGAKTAQRSVVVVSFCVRLESTFCPLTTLALQNREDRRRLPPPRTASEQPETREEEINLKIYNCNAERGEYQYWLCSPVLLLLVDWAGERTREQSPA